MNNPEFAISTWSLHGSLSNGLPLLDVPRQAAEHGIRKLEVCHFHFPDVDVHYLKDFRTALDLHEVELTTLLIDQGDIASPDDNVRFQSLEFNKTWIEVASLLGAKRVRVCAGCQPPSRDVILRSSKGLSDLALFASTVNVDVITENWRETSLDADVLMDILKHCDRPIGLCADTGNAEGPNKYGTLGVLFPRADAIHFKARRLGDGRTDAEDLAECVSMLKSVAYGGAITLIYGDKQDEWVGINSLRNAIDSCVAAIAN